MLFQGFLTSLEIKNKYLDAHLVLEKYMQIEVKHEILTKNILKTFNENEFILDKPFIYIFADDSVCALTLKIDNFIR